MSKPLRTNPVYAHLAYRKAILTRAAVFIRRTYLGDELTDPKEVLVCEDVFPQDAQIPQEEFQHYLEHLNEEIADVSRQLSRFQLVAPLTQGNHEQKRTKSSVQQRPKDSQSHGKGGRAN